MYTIAQTLFELGLSISFAKIGTYLDQVFSRGKIRRYEEIADRVVEAGLRRIRPCLMTTFTTLIALLRAVAYGWKQESLARNAREISELGRELHGRVARLSGHFVRLGSGLDRAVQAYNETLGSLESRVLVQARRFHELGASRSGDEIAELKPLDRSVRSVAQERDLDS